VDRGFIGRVRDEIRYWIQSDWSLSEVERHYDDLSDRYDEVNEAVHAHSRRFTDAARLADIQERARVLEIFSRTGEGTAVLYRRGLVGSAVCVGISGKMGEKCKERLREIGFEEWRWIQMTEYELPLKDREFDVTLCLETVEHVSRPERFVRELARVTKPRGTMVLSTPNVLWEPIHALAAVTGLHHSEGPHRFVRYRRLVEMVERAGFRVEQAETNVLIPAGPEWLVRFGEWLEGRLRHSLMPWIGLRRMLICRRRS
jgi:SAM-dependent methyltransferase